MKNALSYPVVQLKTFLQSKVGGRKKFANFIKTKIEEFTDKKIHRVADIGCGTATVTMELAKLMPDKKVYGLDIGSHYHPHSDTPDNFHYKNYEKNNLSKEFSQENEKFDLILLGGVLHHIPEKQTELFFDDLNKCISKDGIIVVHEHRLSENKMRRYLERHQLNILEMLNNRMLSSMPCPNNFYTKKRLINLFENNGYKLVDNQDTNGSFVTTPTINGNTVYLFKKI